MLGVDFEAQGRRLTLRYSFKALKALEAASGKPATEALAGIGAGGIDLGLLATVFQCGLVERLTAEEVEDAIDAIGVQRAAELIGAAVRDAFPGAEGGAGEAAAGA